MAFAPQNGALVSIAPLPLEPQVLMGDPKAAGAHVGEQGLDGGAVDEQADERLADHGADRNAE
jgi:hypothetical protein